MLHEHECPICERDDGRYVGARGGGTHRYEYGFETPIFRCRSCGLLYPNPLPLPVDANELYGDPAKYFSNHSAEEKLADAARIVSEAARQAPGARRLLDVGSGRGEVLHAAQEAGMEAIGLEVSESFAAESIDRFGVARNARKIP